MHAARRYKLVRAAGIGEPAAMSEEAIPPDVRRFVLGALPSVPHLEALLLLRDRPEGLSHDDLAARLYVTPATAAKLAADLEQSGLVLSEGLRACYGPTNNDLRAAIDALAAVYARNVVAVSGLIHSTTDRKAFQFADAFRVRKEPE